MPRKVKFKVVSRHRQSCYAGGYHYQGRYCRTYNVGRVVTAEPGTLGLMVFLRKKDAEAFISHTGVLHGPAKILRILPIGRGKNIDRICPTQNEVDLNLFYKVPNYCTISAPPGTMGYPAVKMLD